MKIGYARCSTADQILDWQLDALKKEGCERIYEEKMEERLVALAQAIKQIVDDKSRYVDWSTRPHFCTVQKVVFPQLSCVNTKKQIPLSNNGIVDA